jgi:hypothetical protein
VLAAAVGVEAAAGEAVSERAALEEAAAPVGMDRTGLSSSNIHSDRKGWKRSDDHLDVHAHRRGVKGKLTIKW